MKKPVKFIVDTESSFAIVDADRRQICFAVFTPGDNGGSQQAMSDMKEIVSALNAEKQKRTNSCKRCEKLAYMRNYKAAHKG